MTKSNLLTPRVAYKPFEYPWAYDAYVTQQKMHWLPDEVPLHKDQQQFQMMLSEPEKNLITQIFRFFVQADCDVAGGYVHKYMPIFAHKPEITMMLCSFANMEAIHVDAYSKLIDGVGMPEVEYSAFNKFKEMQDKHEYLVNIHPNFIKELWVHNEDKANRLSVIDPKYSYQGYVREVAKSLAVYSAFTEGLQLFSSFAILMNFPRTGKMKGMGQIVTWSIRDEAHHVQSMIKLFKTFIRENPEIWVDDFKKELYDICRKMVELEDAFIDLAFEQGGIEGLTPEEVKKYIRYIADRRLLELGLKTHYKVKKNPLPWMEDILNTVEHANFFESSSTEYSKASTTGDWGDVFGK